MEIATVEWQYVDDVSKIMVRHPSKLGCKSKASPPQAPAIHIIARHLPPHANWAVLAQAWNFHPSCGYSEGLFAQAKMEHCLAKFDAENPARDHRTAVMRCCFKRGAGIACRENHIAIRLVLVEITDFATMQYRLADLPQFPDIRTCRIDVSEKKMRALKAAAAAAAANNGVASAAPTTARAALLPAAHPHINDENRNPLHHQHHHHHHQHHLPPLPPLPPPLLSQLATPTATAAARIVSGMNPAAASMAAAVAPSLLSAADKRLRLNQDGEEMMAEEHSDAAFRHPLCSLHRVTTTTTTTTSTPMPSTEPFHVPSTVAQLQQQHLQLGGGGGHGGAGPIDSHLNDCNAQWDAILEDLAMSGGPPSSPFKWSTPPRPASAASNHHPPHAFYQQQYLQHNHHQGRGG